MKFEYLADHQQFIPTVAEWFHHEWQHLNPSRTKQELITTIHSHLNKNTLPIIFIAIQDDTIVGTVSLRIVEMENYLHLSPWLSSLYVPLEKRHQGIGAFLIKNAIEKAREFQSSHLYLFTESKESWYEKMGWTCLERVSHRGFLSTIMQLSLQGERRERERGQMPTSNRIDNYRHKKRGQMKS